ncbi:hypothetical protein OsJ_05581 [Oryza sativa Japonica Group]|uniref:DUF630 domain-containing protein n=1 Tax=Oryza sativa subsp. japonica TaxID=39947 RepID=A3A3N9_ORYSJ|nr:hypothetical protein OsJ_05581 [Oryza sativa Japonica Group]
MGCSSSKKVEEEAAVKTCHDRRSFVKKAIAQRNLLASSHVAYAHSLRRVSLALFYCLAEDEHLYFLQDTAASSAAPCRHRPCSPERKVLVMNWLRPDAGCFFGGAPVAPGGGGGAAMTKRGGGEAMTKMTSRCRSWKKKATTPPTTTTATAMSSCRAEASPAAVERPMAEEEEEEKTVDRVKNELRVVASEEIEQQSTPGFTVYVDRPPASMAEAMRDIQGHFVKIVDTANHVSVLLEVVPYQRKVRPAAPSDGDDEEGGGEVSPEPFELFKSHKESLDRLYEWEKRLYEEVKVETPISSKL